MRKAKLAVYALLFICIAGILVHSAMKKTRTVERDIPTLFNFYYNNKDKDPLKAKRALDLILKQEPSNATAILAKSNWFVQQGDTQAALKFLQNLHILEDPITKTPFSIDSLTEDYRTSLVTNELLIEKIMNHIKPYKAHFVLIDPTS